jgi:hypothetical protein
MKLTIFSALTCAFFATSARAQEPLAKPRQKDNMVVIQTPDSANVALATLARAFVAQGYTVDKLDAQFLTLRLAPKTLATTFAPVLLARATATAGANSSLRVTGEYRAIAMGRPLNGLAEMQGSEKGVAVSSFRALEKVALSYLGGKVSYTNQ